MTSRLRPSRAALVLGLLLALVLPLSVTSAVAQVAVPDPEIDPFFVAPADLADLAPGTIIRSRPVELNVVGGPGLTLPMVGAKGYQILVRSNDAKDRPAAVTATVVVPTSGARHQLLAYQPATDSLGAKCEPSYGLQTGEEKEAGLIQLAVQQGLTVVVPDHQGPRHAYAAGRMAAHAVLDSIRGALQFPEAELAGAESKVAMVGYSGGAIATGWAAELHPAYAPEVNLVGVVSGGTPADLELAASYMDGGVAGGLFLAASVGMSREYPELLSILNDKGRAEVEKMKDLCNSDFVARYPFASVEDYSDVPDPLRTPVAQEVLRINKMGLEDAPTAPVLLWHSRFDELIPYAAARELRQRWCDLGGEVRLVTNFTSEHVTGAVVMVPQALTWLLDRYAGKPVGTTCA